MWILTHYFLRFFHDTLSYHLVDKLTNDNESTELCIYGAVGE